MKFEARTETNDLQIFDITTENKLGKIVTGALVGGAVATFGLVSNLPTTFDDERVTARFLNQNGKLMDQGSTVQKIIEVAKHGGQVHFDNVHNKASFVIK